jgi:hypothetical protein
MKGSDVQISDMIFISTTGQFYTEINLSKMDYNEETARQATGTATTVVD